jgi:MoxR-like ATPase
MTETTNLLERVEELYAEVLKTFIGSREPVRTAIIGLATGLPVLIEDIPGVGKTTLARSLAAACSLDFGRIQFTPDLLPGDITGMTIWSQEKRDFIFKPGAVMHQFVLADEINRASARTQSALLEAMQEGSVSVDGVTYELPRPFFVIATQNPLSFAGTFQLPETQLDRFGFCLSIGYPDRDGEADIIAMGRSENPFEKVRPVMSAEDIEALRSAARGIRTERMVVDYVIRIAEATRISSLLKAGMSPRASLHLTRAGQAAALIDGRDYVLPEDIRALAVPVLAHRLTPSPDARMSGKSAAQVVADLVQKIPMPTGLP